MNKLEFLIEFKDFCLNEEFSLFQYKEIKHRVTQETLDYLSANELDSVDSIAVHLEEGRSVSVIVGLIEGDVPLVKLKNAYRDFRVRKGRKQRLLQSTGQPLLSALLSIYSGKLVMHTV